MFERINRGLRLVLAAYLVVSSQPALSLICERVFCTACPVQGRGSSWPIWLARARSLLSRLEFGKGAGTMMITRRPYTEIMEVLTGSPEALVGVRGPMRALDLERIYTGQSTLLSVGEGWSGFIMELINTFRLRNRFNHQYQVGHIYALDSAYPKRKSEFEIPELMHGLETFPYDVHEFILAHTANYLRQDMRSFVVRNRSGEKVLFDDIIFANSVSNLMRFKGELSLDFDAVWTTIVHSLSQLKEGGQLWIWPVYGAEQFYIELGQRLLEHGWINNYSAQPAKIPENLVHDESIRDQRWLFVMQR